jgi:hypothetical protein
MLASFQCVLALLVAGQGQAADRSQLTQGVGEMVAMGGTPGAMVASGSPAFVVLTAKAEGATGSAFCCHAHRQRACAGRWPQLLFWSEST